MLSSVEHENVLQPWAKMVMFDLSCLSVKIVSNQNKLIFCLDVYNTVRYDKAFLTFVQICIYKKVSCFCSHYLVDFTVILQF